MSKKQNPEIPQKLIDALIRTVIEQGFAPGIDAITERAGVSKMTAYTQFTSRPGMTVAALERVGREARKSLEAAVRQPGSGSPGDFNGVTDCMVRQLTDHDNPLASLSHCRNPPPHRPAAGCPLLSRGSHPSGKGPAV